LAPVRIIISFCSILYQINNITATILRIYPMTFGSLISKQPGVDNTNEVLYTAPAGKLVEGKVYVVNKGPSSVRFRVGLSTGGLSDYNTSSGYLIFNQDLPVGEYYQSETIYFGDGQSVIIRSDSTDIFFNLLGTETDDTVGSGLVAQKSTTGSNGNELMFTSPADFTGNLFVCNRSSFDSRVRVGVGSTDKDYIEYNYTVERDTTHFRENLRIGTGEVVYIRSDNPGESFVLTGFYGSGANNFPNNVGVGSTLQANDVYAVQSVSIGITSPGSNALKVIGSTELSGLTVTDNVRIENNLQTVGIITAQGGFTSNSTNPVEISVVGTDLTFTVQGVGSTTLTLI